MRASDIPFGSEFSPGVIHDFPRLLEMLEHHLPDRRALQADIDNTYFSHQNRGSNPNKTLGDNTVLSMKEYGLIAVTRKAYELTDLGRELVSLRHEAANLLQRFAIHVLLNCKGLTLLECVRDLQSAGVQLTKVNIANELRRRGLHVPENGKHLNNLRQWLDKFGLVNPTGEKSGDGLWQPNEYNVGRLLGMTMAEVDELAELTKEQRDFAKALALLDEQDIPSNKVRELASSLYGTVFPEGGLPQSVLHKLKAIGLIDWAKTTVGRGAKPHTVSPTDKLRNTYLTPLLESTERSVGAAYKKLVRLRYSDILSDLNSPDTGVKGIALEALCFYLARLLDLQFVDWRRRGAETGGLEVDVLFEGTRLLFSRWQIQCKNTQQANGDDLAKEIGIATAMRTNVVMFVCTGRIGPTVRRLADQVMANTAMQVILIDGLILDRISSNPAALADVLNEQSRRTRGVKHGQLESQDAWSGE